MPLAGCFYRGVGLADACFKHKLARCVHEITPLNAGDQVRADIMQIKTGLSPIANEDQDDDDDVLQDRRMGAQQTKEKAAAGADLTTKTAPHLAAAAKTEGSAADTADADDSPKKRAERQKKAGLSERGLRNLYDMEALLAMFFGKRSNVWSPENPEGSIPMAIADNQLMRPELIEFYNSPGKLALKPQDLTYADRGMCSKRLLDAICAMVNTTPDGFFFEDDKKDQWPKPIKEIKIEHIVVGNGATGVLDALFWALINDGDGILLSQPHYVSGAFGSRCLQKSKREWD